MTIVNLSAPPQHPSPPRRGSDFAGLLVQVQRAGLLDRRPAYYATRIALTVALFATGWTCFALVGDSWWQLATAVLLAVAFAQTAFLGHDAGHMQIFRSRRANAVLGLILGDLAIGLSYDWWVGNHNRHHAHPNTEGSDPDLDIPLLALSARRVASSGSVGRAVHRYQAYFFFPLLSLQAVGFHVESVKLLLGRGGRHRVSERILIAVHFATYLAAVYLVLSPWLAVTFVVVHQGLLGVYLGCSFAPNHKGMPTTSAADEADFLRRQVLTSRNIRGGRFVDVLVGGLNYQVEHHLFPNMPARSLRLAQPLVRAYCHDRELAYTETGMLDSYRQILRHLHTVGRGTPHLGARVDTRGPSMTR